MQCIIPCAGESSRMGSIPKHLIRVGGKPIITHVVDFWRDKVDGFIFVMKRSSTYMWELLPENSAVVFQDEPKGLADAILRVEPYIVDKRFVVALGDCLYKGKFGPEGSGLGVGTWIGCSPEINKNFLVRTSSSTGLIEELVEKPKGDFTLGLCGMGVYFLDDRVFEYIREAKAKPGGGDLTEVLQDMVNAGEELGPVMFRGKYINVGSPEDLKVAEDLLV